MPADIALFNQCVTHRKGTKLSALVGNSIPILCATPEWNDGFVSVESAKFGIADFAMTKAQHPDMVSTKTFGDFVKPHLVTGPRGTYPIPVKSGSFSHAAYSDVGSFIYKNYLGGCLTF